MKIYEGRKKALDECIEKIDPACLCTTTGWVPVEKPKEDNEGFMETMSAITGLSGGALLVYVIISEGSRLFPPRNLIPVP